MNAGNERIPKVLMLVSSLPPMPTGGAEKQAILLGHELIRRGIPVSFIAPGRKTNKGKEFLDGMPVYRMDSVLSRLFAIFSRQKKNRAKPVEKIEFDDSKERTSEITRKAGLPTLIYYNLFYWHALIFLWKRRNTFDIIHAHTMEWSAIVAERLGRKLGKSVVIKDSTMNGFRSLRRFIGGKHIQQRIIKGATFVAMTTVIEENLKSENIPEEKIVSIPNGIPVREQRRTENPGQRLVLFIGNLYQQPAKGVDILLKAWSQVSPDFPDSILQIIGEGVTPGYLEFVKRLHIAHAVKFLGGQSNPEPYFREATLFVLPSRREGMSNALMEAMVYGLPCVATQISGNSDLIRHRVSGFLVPPMDVKGLAEGIRFMLSNPAEAAAMGRMARDTIRDGFDIQTVADKYISLYKELIATKKNPVS